MFRGGQVAVGEVSGSCAPAPVSVNLLLNIFYIFVMLTDCGLATPSGDLELGQHLA